MNNRAKNDLRTIEISKGLVSMVLERTGDFVKKYNREQDIEFNSADYKSRYGLRELVISVYTQGLADAKEALTDNNHGKH